jgi:hypothetical protein
MKVTTVTATIKYSAEAKGAWRTIELGAEAQVALNEDWHTAQEQLYLQLGQQMKTLWANGNGKSAAQELPEPETPPPAREYWCAEHKTKFRKFVKGNQTWYSHRTSNGWCKES